MTDTPNSTSAPVNPADPVFQTRAELEAWTARTVREATTPAAMIDGLDTIRRVTLAHLHLKGE